MFDEAYAALLRPHERVAYRVAAAITGWNGNAEEATQNAFVKAYRSLPRFRVGAAFRPWLLRIVVNEAHNVVRAERRHERLGARAAERHEAPFPGPDEAVLAREEVESVFGALADCPTPTGWRSSLATSPSCRCRGRRAPGDVEGGVPRAVARARRRTCRPLARGAARGTFTLVGADGTVHREAFEVSPGALLWQRAGMAFLLQGAGSRENAVRLAAGT